MTRLALFAIAFAAMLLGMDRTLGVYDEGVILTGAMRAAAGDIPHADFYANYGPAQFYVLAALFKLFGETALVERLYDTAVRAGIVVMAYALLEPVVPRRIALGVAAAAGLWLFGIGFYGYPLFPVILLTLIAAALVQPALAGDASWQRPFGAGVAVALAALVRYDAGFVVFVGFVAVLAATRNPRALVAHVAGTSAAFLAAVAVYACFAPLGPFFHDIFVFSIPNYGPRRNLPFPGWREISRSPEELTVYTTFATCVAGAALLAVERGGILQRSRVHLVGLTFVVLAVLLYFKGWVRVSAIHLMSSIVCSLVALGALGPVAWRRGGASRAVCAVLALLAGAPALECAAMALSKRMAQRTAGFSSCTAPPELATIRCFILDSDRERAAVYVAQNTAPDERVFVGLGRHDKILIHDAISYFAMRRMPATRWHHFDSGLQTGERIQGEMVAELERGAVRWAILETTWDAVEEPNESARSSGVRVLDSYLRANYAVVASFGEVFVLRHR